MKGGAQRKGGLEGHRAAEIRTQAKRNAMKVLCQPQGVRRKAAERAVKCSHGLGKQSTKTNRRMGPELPEKGRPVRGGGASSENWEKKWEHKYILVEN